MKRAKFMALPFDYDEFELGCDNIEDEYAFFETSMGWIEQHCPDLGAIVYFLFVSYLQSGSDTLSSMEDAYVQAGVFDTIVESDSDSWEDVYEDREDDE